MHLLLIPPTSSDDNRAFAISLGVGFGIAFYIWIFFKIRMQFFDKSLRRQLIKFLGEELRKTIELHEKTFPGYDLVSLNRAINSFFSEMCSSSAALGAATFDDVRTILNAEPSSYIAKQKPSTPAYTRLPVDVDEEESFISSCVYACRLKPEGANIPEEKVLLILQSVSSHANVEEDMG